jgi:hypothetical protein
MSDSLVCDHSDFESEGSELRRENGLDDDMGDIMRVTITQVGDAGTSNYPVMTSALRQEHFSGGV